MKKLLKEFEEFINRGNVMDMAVGVIIGGAFTSIVTSLTENIINPLIKLLSGGGTDKVSSLVVPGTEIDFGKFIGACINFLIVAAIVFALIKVVNKMHQIAEKAMGRDGNEDEAPAPAPTCPHCLEEVHEGASKCCHCGSDLA